MKCRDFQVTLLCARDLPNVRNFFQMRVYAKVSISGLDSEWSTPVDRERETAPDWNWKIKFTLPEEIVQNEGSLLSIKLYCERSLNHDKYVGEVNLYLKKLFKCGLALENLEYDVLRTDADGAFGKLKISYAFEETQIAVAEEDSGFGKALLKGVLHAVVHVVVHGVVHVLAH